MLAGMAAVATALTEMVGATCWSLTDAEVAGLLDQISTAEARLTAVKLAAVFEADGRGLGRADGATDTAAWLRHRQLAHPTTAARTVELASALGGQCALTGAALSAGRLSADHARTIVTALGLLAAGIDPDTRACAEDFLIDQACVLDPLLLARVGRDLAETLRSAPHTDGPAPAEPAGGELHRSVAADGMVRWHGWLDREADALLCAAIDPLAAPRPAADGTRDLRSAGRRRAEALLSLTRLALASDGLPDSGGLRPTVVVTIDYATLVGRLPGGGRLQTGELASPETARRLACDAQILPVVLGSAGQPLDVGRATRNIAPAIRTALNVRDDGCAFPGCEAKKAWCDAHHIRHWSDGGATAVENLVLLCGIHHSTIHHQGWTVSIDPDGLPSFHPPPWIDPGQSPRRHHRYRLRRLPFDPAACRPPT